jgi:multidrug efflux system outer membrane protein
LAPTYQRPAIGTPAAFKEAPWQPAGSNVVPSGKWWEAFGDPALTALEERIDKGSFDLAAASARYQQALGAARQARGDLFPQVGASTSIERQRQSANRSSSPGRPNTFTDKAIGASLSYELDLFGQVRNRIAAGEASAKAAAFDVDGIRLGLQTQLASTYFDLRGLDARITLLRQTVASYQRAFDLTDTRHSGGIASGIDVSRAQTQLSSAKSELSTVEIDRAQDEHAIAVLVGEDLHHRRRRSAAAAARDRRRPALDPARTTSRHRRRRTPRRRRQCRDRRRESRLVPQHQLGRSGRLRGSRRQLAERAEHVLGARAAASSAVDLRWRQAPCRREDRAGAI